MPSDFDNTVEVTESSTTVNKFISTLRNLPPCEEDTFRIFERNHREFYSVHFDTATWASMQIYKTTNVVKYIGGDNITGIPTLNLTPSIGENFMREQIKFKKIELWGLVGKGASQYGPIKKTSPGNYQELEDLLFGEVEIASSPIVMAARLEVSHGNKKIGVCFCDSTMQTFQVLEFLDNDIFSNFESLIIQIGVSECLINLYDSSYDHIKLKEVLERCDVMITKAPNNKFESASIAQDLSRLLKPSISVETLNELNLNIAMKSTSCLINYLQLLDYPDNMNQYAIDTYNLSQYVRLDGSAFKALNLMPGAKDSNKYSSLYGLLNHCKTSQGSRLLSQWLKQPCTNPQDIQERLDLVQIFLDDYQLKDTLHNQLLKSIPDLCRICNRVKRNKSSLQDVIRLYQVVTKLPEFVQAIDQSQHAPQLEAAYNRFLREYTASLQKLQEMVEETVDLAAADNHIYKIKPNFDPKLKEVDVQMENTLNQINKLYRQMANQLDLEMDKKIKLERSNAYGYCFRVTKSDAPKLRNESGIVELSVQKTATLFTTAKLKQFSEEFEDLSTSYNTVQSALVSQVLVVTSSYCNVFEALNGLIAHLDVIVSFAQAAESAPFPYVKPNILTGESDRLELRGARHPCLERQEDVSFIPNNLSMERDKKEFLIITGPNMGGKSTYIRQTAIIVLMAQIGSFVPCTQADICIFDGILARVGAGDSQLKGISTFMAEMLETSNIIKSATSKTLIVIDELGRGTSTYDGFGLAWAISEHISTNIKAFCLFATHFHELTTLKDKVPTVHNLHVTAHIDSNSRKMALLYEIREGVCDQSFGIHVAEIANCPSSVVKLAKRKVEQLEAQEQHTDHNYGLTPQQIQEGVVKMEKFKELASSTDPSQSSELKALAQEISQDPYIQKILQNF